MSASNVFENGLLSLFLENANYANVGDATGLRGSSTAGVLYAGLHPSPGPTDSGSQNSSEAAYSPYARISIARSTAGWTVASGVGDNDSAITFAACVTGSETEAYFSLGSDSTAAGNLFVWGALSSNLAVSAGITPSFASGAMDVTVD